MNISEQKFQDKGLWQDKVGTIREDYWQFEINKPNSKWASLNTTQKGLENFMAQLRSLDLNKYDVSTTFSLSQNIEFRTLRRGVAYLDEYLEEREELYILPNLTGYEYTIIDYEEFPNIAANKVLVKWYPKQKKRLMALSLEYQQGDLTIHLNPEGFDDFMSVLQLCADLYFHVDIFHPRPKIIERYGDSKFFLTDLPESCSDDLVVHLNFWKEHEMPKLVNIFSYETYDKAGQKQQELFLDISPKGCLELEAVISTCVEQFEQRDFLDYAVGSIIEAYTDKIYTSPYEDRLISATVKIYPRVRWVFLRNTDLYLFSAEYDVENDIVYFYISYNELANKLFPIFIRWQARLGFGMGYDWKLPADMSQEEFINKHCESVNAYNLANIRYGKASWYKFPSLLAIRRFKKGEEETYGIPCVGVYEAREFDDENIIYRTPTHALIIDAPTFYFLIGPQDKLRPPIWEDD